MKIFLNLCLLSSLLLCQNSCAIPKMNLREESQVFSKQIPSHKWNVARKLYSGKVEGKFGWKKIDLTGLMIIQTDEMENVNVLFQTVMGNTLFHFKWNKYDQFEVVSCIDNMSHPALIKTLQKDFEIMMGMHLVYQQSYELTQNEQLDRYLYTSDHQAIVDIYLKKIKDNELQIEQIILGNRKEQIVSFTFSENYNWNQLPLSVFIKHYKANFTINLQEITEDAFISE